MSDTYEKNPKGRGFGYEHDNQLYRRVITQKQHFGLQVQRATLQWFSQTEERHLRVRHG